MFGLDADVDIDFLIEKELIQVCYGQYEIILNFFLDVSISVEGKVCISEDNFKNSFNCNDPKLVVWLHDMIGDKISATENKGYGNITLIFSSGKSLMIMDSFTDGESYSITSDKIQIIV